MGRTDEAEAEYLFGSTSSKNDLAKRRTALAQERMRIRSQLARKENGTDDFKRDDDPEELTATAMRKSTT